MSDTAPDVAHGFHVFRDGNEWCAVGPHFRCLADSGAGFGETPEAAVEALREVIKHMPTFADFKVHE